MEPFNLDAHFEIILLSNQQNQLSLIVFETGT